MPHGSANFTFPRPGPSSPPTTPNSARSKHPDVDADGYITIVRRRRRGYPKFGPSPPENIAPKGFGHQFSYTPPDKDIPSDDSDPESESEADEADGESKASNRTKDKASSAESIEEDDEHARRPPVIRPIDEDTDFTVEELSDDDIGYDDLEVVQPDQTEDAKSDNGSQASKAKERDIIDALKKLQCGGDKEKEEARQFESAQRAKYVRRKKRWSMASKKRSHALSKGSLSSDNDDVEPLDDIHQPGASARRLRRRTQGPEDSERPNRTSLLFEDPPKEFDELDELAIIDEPPPLLSELWMGELWSSDEDDDGTEDIELLLPAWLMEIESNPSRPATPVSETS